jgi:predicted RNA binding protein YcfA (HicA-like mRNA interferase family)
MTKRVFSGKRVIKILCREFGFYFVSQKGSHVKLKKKVKNREIITIVPLVDATSKKNIIKLYGENS